MALKDRLKRLEGATPAPRCPACAGWPPTRVTYINDVMHGEREPTTPDRCERCGFRPLRIEVEYLDWPPNAAARKEEQPCRTTRT